MKSTTRVQLSVMMFLEFFIWGGWFVTLETFLGANLQANGNQIANIYSTQSWRAIIAPFILVGLILAQLMAHQLTILCLDEIDGFQ